MTVPPGPRGTELLGFFRDTLGFLQSTAQRYGPFSYFRILHQHLYLATDAEIVKDVLITRQSYFGRDLGAIILRELVGDGLITRDEPDHKERRRILQPAFHREQIASYVEAMGLETKAALSAWPLHQPLNMGTEMRRITLAIIGSILFGPEFRESATAVSTILGRVMKRAGHIAPFLSLFKPFTRSYRRSFPNGRSLFFANERTALDKILQPLILRRRGSSSLSSAGRESVARSSSSRDVLSLLLALQEDEDGRFSDDAIRNEIVTFVLAGHETTATALTWAVYELSRHPEVQERLAAESTAVLGDRAPTIEDLPRLLYAANVFNETLRLYPPVPVYGRRVLQPISLANFQVPANSSVLLSPFINARNSNYFPEPESFLPSRWDTDPPPHRFAYFPFGGGAKMCIGDTFAKTEGTLILAALASRFRLSPTDAPEPRFNSRATLQPLNPVLLKAESRK